MTKDFPDSKNIEFPEISGDETIIGVHSSGIHLEEGTNTSSGRYYCTSCRNKIHCYVKVDRDTNEAIVHNTCKDKICECKCKTHYSCKKCGYLHSYGKECNKPKNNLSRDPKDVKKLDELLKSWNKSKSQRLGRG